MWWADASPHPNSCFVEGLTWDPRSPKKCDHRGALCVTDSLVQNTTGHHQGPLIVTVLKRWTSVNYRNWTTTSGTCDIELQTYCWLMEEFRLTSWGWYFIPLFTTGFNTSKRWVFLLDFWLPPAVGPKSTTFATQGDFQKASATTSALNSLLPQKVLLGAGGELIFPRSFLNDTW